MSEDLNARTAVLLALVRDIMNRDPLPFDEHIRKSLPSAPGVYAITDDGGRVMRVGRTDHQTLQDRVYRNHLMGNQPGNLRAQLVGARVCEDMEEAKRWIRGHCCVRFAAEPELASRGVSAKWLEHFAIAVLQPRFSD